MRPPGGRDRSGVRRLVILGIVVFAAAVAGLLAGSRWIRPEVRVPPGSAPTQRATAWPDGTFTATLDARSRATWTAIDLGTGRVGEGESGDLLAQRHVLRAPHGAIDLGPIGLSEARVPADARWSGDELRAGATGNPALAGWYRYSYWTHLLESRGHSYAIRAADGGVAYLTIEGYYCEPEGSGCVTIRYRLP